MKHGLFLLQGSALRFECQPLETQLQYVSETSWFCPCFGRLQVDSVGYDRRRDKNQSEKRE